MCTESGDIKTCMAEEKHVCHYSMKAHREESCGIKTLMKLQNGSEVKNYEHYFLVIPKRLLLNAACTLVRKKNNPPIY